MEVLYGIMKHILLEDFILLELQHDYSPCMAVFSIIPHLADTFNTDIRLILITVYTLYLLTMHILDT